MRVNIILQQQRIEDGQSPFSTRIQRVRKMLVNAEQLELLSRTQVKNVSN